MLFSERLALENEYELWAEEASKDLNAKVDTTRLSTALIFLKYKGLLADCDDNTYIVKLKMAIRKISEQNYKASNDYSRLSMAAREEGELTDALALAGRAAGLAEANVLLGKILQEFGLMDIVALDIITRREKE